MIQKAVYLFFLWALLPGCLSAQSSFDWLDYPFDVHHQTLPNGETVAYVDEGDADQVILMIHGLGSYLPAWQKNISGLKEDFRIIALDLPGYGKSSKTAEQYNIPFFAETVVQLLEALSVDKAYLTGHSMGGQIALYITLEYQDKIEGLILSAPAGFEQFSDQHRQVFQMTVNKESIMNTGEDAIRMNAMNTFHQFPEEASFMIEDRLKMRDDPDFENYSRAQAESIFAMLDEPVFDRLSDIDVPVLVVYGFQDGLIPNPYLNPDLTTQSVAEAGTAELQNGELIMIEDAGHFVHFEKSEEFNQAVRIFLNLN